MTKIRGHRSHSFFWMILSKKMNKIKIVVALGDLPAKYSTINPAQFVFIWAGLAVLFSRQIGSSSHNFDLLQISWVKSTQ